MGRALGNRDDAVKQYKHFKHKWKKKQKEPKKQNKMVYCIVKNSVSLRELKKNNSKSSKKFCNSSSNSSSNGSDYNSSIYRYRNWDGDKQPDGPRDINILDHVVI